VKGRDLQLWAAECKFRSPASAYRALGLPDRTWRKYVNENPDRELPVYLALACAAVKAGLKPWSRNARSAPGKLYLGNLPNEPSED
jgi:hypothetical protein